MKRPLSLYDRHVALRFGAAYLALVCALVVFFIVLHYVEYVDDFMDRGATQFEVFTVYYPNYVPEIVRLISPLALFMACIHLTGRLAQKLELTAFQTSGVRLTRIMRPFVVVALVLTGFMFWFNGWVVPKTNRVRVAFELQYTKDAPRMAEYNNIHRQTGRGGVLSVGFFERSSQTAFTVSLQRFNGEQQLVERIDSPRMEWIDSLRVWRLLSPVVRRFDDQGFEHMVDRRSIDTTLTLLPRDISRTDGDVEAMTIGEAGDYIDALRRSGADELGMPLVVYFGKFAYPLSNLILVLLGVPLAAVRRRGGQAVVISLGLFTAFSYLALMKLMEPFGYSGSLPPMVAAWLPHGIFLVLALFALARSRM